MPVHSEHDRSHVDRIIKARSAFCAVTNEEVRRALRRRIRSCEKIVTFKTFHADMVMLEICYRPLLHLWRPTKSSSLRRTCQESFQGNAEAFEVEYAELWLYSIRNTSALFEEVTRPSGPCETGRAIRESSAMGRLAFFAESRGLHSPQVELAASCSAERHEQKRNPEVAPLSGESVKVRLQDRCGRPTERDYAKFWRNLSLDRVFGLQGKSTGQYATPFAVARSFVRCLLPRPSPLSGAGEGGAVDCDVELDDDGVATETSSVTATHRHRDRDDDRTTSARPNSEHDNGSLTSHHASSCLEEPPESEMPQFLREGETDLEVGDTDSDTRTQLQRDPSSAARPQRVSSVARTHRPRSLFLWRSEGMADPGGGLGGGDSEIRGVPWRDGNEADTAAGRGNVEPVCGREDRGIASPPGSAGNLHWCQRRFKVTKSGDTKAGRQRQKDQRLRRLRLVDEHLRASERNSCSPYP